ncbi:MAG: redoxin domain-containing protein [Chloroflexi bacterium]|nr:redoxin domain-containing protein [Chloroflexota bacterium]
MLVGIGAVGLIAGRVRPAAVPLSATSTPGEAGSASLPPSPSTRAEDVDPGAKAPDFSLKDLDGRTVTLSQFRGQSVMLFFWATW